MATLLFLYVFVVLIFIYCYSLQAGNLTVLVVITTFVLFFTYVFYDTLFHKTYEISLSNKSIVLTSWGNIFLGFPKDTVINFDEIEKATLMGGISMDLNFHIFLKNKSVVTIGWNYFRNEEFHLMKQELKKLLAEKWS